MGFRFPHPGRVGPPYKNNHEERPAACGAFFILSIRTVSTVQSGHRFKPTTHNGGLGIIFVDIFFFNIVFIHPFFFIFHQIVLFQWFLF